MSRSNSFLPKGSEFKSGTGMVLSNTKTSPKPANDFVEEAYNEGLPSAPHVIPSLPMGVGQAKNKLLTRKRKRSRHPLRELRIQRGYTLEELAELTQLSPSYLSRLESGSRRLNADILQKVALVLSCHPGDLLPHSSHHSKVSNWGQGTATEHSNLQAAQDLPFYLIKDNEGTSLQFEKASEWVARPQELSGVQNAFAFALTSAFMTPRYRPGDRVFVHPHRPLSTNCSVLIITHENTVYLGDFLQWTGKLSATDPEYLIIKLYERQIDGYKERKVSIPHSDIRNTYRIIGSMEAA